MTGTHWTAALLTASVMTMLSVPSNAQQPTHPMQAPITQAQDTSQFGGLPVLPSCLSFAVDRGDPTTGPSMLLIKMTAGCVVPWHWHSAREELMLVSGTGKIEFPDVPASTVNAGGYVLLPATHHHQFTCETACTFFDAIAGKFDIHYIDATGKEIAAEKALHAVSETPASPQ